MSSVVSSLEKWVARANRLGARLHLAVTPGYHPMGTYRRAGSPRPHEAILHRWKLIEPLLDQYDINNFCDLGCAEGYYVRQVALKGIPAIGIDCNEKRFRRASSVSLIDGVRLPWCFLPMNINRESIRGLPKFDMVACMSLIHHVIYRQGIDESRAILKEIAILTKKCLVFDMGGPEEVSNEWAAALTLFKGDLTETIPAFLQQCGFRDVLVLGHTLGYRDTVCRPLFCAVPDPGRAVCN